MSGERIRIKMLAYDHEVIDQAAKQIVETAKASGAKVVVLYRFQRAEKFTRFFGLRMLTRSLDHNLKLERISAWWISTTLPQKRLVVSKR